MTPVVCKPFENAFYESFRIAEINPKKTVIIAFRSYADFVKPFLYAKMLSEIRTYFFLQLFFDDSIRNLQTAKNMGLHTVWVCFK